MRRHKNYNLFIYGKSEGGGSGTNTSSPSNSLVSVITEPSLELHGCGSSGRIRRKGGVEREGGKVPMVRQGREKHAGKLDGIYVSLLSSGGGFEQKKKGKKEKRKRGGECV